MPKSKKTKPDVTPVAAPFAAFHPAAAQAWMEITTECARFAMDRVQQDFAAQRAMMTCASPADLMAMQSDHCRAAAQSYTDHATRMVGLMTAAAGMASRTGSSPFRRAYDDIPL